MDSELLTRCINFHGHPLLTLLTSTHGKQLQALDLQGIDYKVYQSRVSEVSKQSTSYRTELMKLISSKADVLFENGRILPKLKENSLSDFGYKDKYEHMAPLEFFLKVPKEKRLEMFFKMVKQGDVMIGRVVSVVSDNVQIIRVTALDFGPHRALCDIEVKAHLRKEDTIAEPSDQDERRRYRLNTLLRLEVLHVDAMDQYLLVGTKGVTLTPEMKATVVLGKVSSLDEPSINKAMIQQTVKCYDKCLREMRAFQNPRSVQHLTSLRNINLTCNSSLMKTLSSGFPERDTCVSLRKAQMSRWAHKSVAEGVEFFKNGQQEEAFQCLNKALQIDGENVEAFVAKGALLANLGRFEKAVEEFEKALSFNATHSNARKYICETLVELGKQLEDEGKNEEAKEKYTKCCEIQPDHENGKSALAALNLKMNPNKAAVYEDSEKVIRDLIAAEDQFIRKHQESDAADKKVSQVAPNVGNSSDSKKVSQVAPSVIKSSDSSLKTDNKSSLKMNADPSSTSVLKLKTDSSVVNIRVLGSSTTTMPHANSFHPRDSTHQSLHCNSAQTPMFVATPINSSWPPPFHPVYNVPSFQPPGFIQAPPMLPFHSIPPPVIHTKANSADDDYRERVENFLKQLEDPRSSKLKKEKEKIRRYEKKRKRSRDFHRKRSSSSSLSSSSDSSEGERSRSKHKKKKKKKESFHKKDFKGKNYDKGNISEFEPKIKSDEKSVNMKSENKNILPKQEKLLDAKYESPSAGIMKPTMDLSDLDHLQERLSAYYKKFEATAEETTLVSDYLPLKKMDKEAEKYPDRKLKSDAKSGESRNEDSLHQLQVIMDQYKKESQVPKVGLSNEDLKEAVYEAKMRSIEKSKEIRTEKELKAKRYSMEREKKANKNFPEEQKRKRKEESLEKHVKKSHRRRHSSSDFSDADLRNRKRSVSEQQVSHSSKPSRFEPMTAQERQEMVDAVKNRIKMQIKVGIMNPEVDQTKLAELLNKLQSRSDDKSEANSSGHISKINVPINKRNQGDDDKSPLIQQHGIKHALIKFKLGEKGTAVNNNPFKSSRWEGEGETVKSKNRKISSPERSSRFGKWDPIDTSKKISDKSLHDFESYLQVAREKQMKEMRERNKGFLKPVLD